MRFIPEAISRCWTVAAALAGLLTAAPAGAQNPAPVPIHSAAPLVLAAGERAYSVPLAFPGFDPATVIRVHAFGATGNLLPDAVRVQPQPVVADAGAYVGQKVAVVSVDGTRQDPTTIVLDLVGPSGVAATLRVPLAAPKPDIGSVVFGPGVGTAELALRPRERVETRVTVRGGPFYRDARIVLPAPLEVETDPVGDDRTVLTGTIRQPERALHELPVGSVTLSLANTVGGEARTLVTLRGPRPYVAPPERVTVSGQAREAVKLVIENVSDAARVEIEAERDVAFAPISVPLADVVTETLSFEVEIPALANPTAAARVRVVNRDNSLSDPVELRLVRAAVPTLAISGADRLTPGVPAAVTFQAQNDPGLRFTGLGTQYLLSVGGIAVPLQGAVTDPQKTALRATIVLPMELAPTVGEEVVSAVELRGPDLPDNRLDGLMTVSALPLIELPTHVTLRPGESRVVALQGRRLSKLELRGTLAVQVTAQEMKHEIGTATISALRTAQPGAVERVEGFRDVQAAGLNVRIVPWLEHPTLAEHARYRSGEAAVQPFRGRDTLEVSPGKEMRFSITPISTVPAEGELVRAQIAREGTVVWQDSVLVLPGTGGEFRRSFTPGDVFPHGQEFTLTMTGQGGAFVQQRFRLKYERGFFCSGCVKVHTGVAAVQMPIGGPARDRYSDGLFSGVTLGFSVPWDEVANHFNFEFVRLIALATASTPPALPEEEEEDEAESAAAADLFPTVAAQQEDEEDAEPRQGIALGASFGVLLWETIFFTAGWDTRGDDFQEGLVFSFGGTLDLSSIPGLLRRQ